MQFHIPYCIMCGEREVQLVVNSAGGGYCSKECEESYHEEDGYNYKYNAAGDGWSHDDCERVTEWA